MACPFVSFILFYAYRAPDCLLLNMQNKSLLWKVRARIGVTIVGCCNDVQFNLGVRGIAPVVIAVGELYADALDQNGRKEAHQGRQSYSSINCELAL